ncbi:outer membrane protein assembly factor BamE [Martelella mangrovi]|uniref:Outer membrane protein assembly factor BamE (Lipoprotein component of BamABCDE complex) n=1 Tax=Martelella mangrovi TaxID=1397477 RepID=A0ABV2ID34_9HYPH
MLKRVSIAVLAGAIFVGPAFAGGLNEQKANMRFESVTPALTELDANFVRDGKPVTVELVRQVEIGAAQEQVASLLGQPVQAAKRGNTSVWDYNLKFTTARDGEIVCQYKVLFDKTQKVDETVWRRPQCRDLMTGRG